MRIFRWICVCPNAVLHGFISALTGLAGFTPSGESLSCCLPNKKVTKEKCTLHPGQAAQRPDWIRFAHPSGQPSAVTPLRYVSSLRRCFGGRAWRPLTRGRPCPLVPRSASCLALTLRNTCTRPTDGTGPRACRISAKLEYRASVWVFKAASAQTMPVAPSEGRAQVLWSRSAGMDAGRAAPGHGRPVAARLRSSTGAREPRRRRGRMSGLDLLVPFGGPAIRAMPKGTRPTGRN
jgi:hypothetical protein